MSAGAHNAIPDLGGEARFEELVERHAPQVLSVCRSVLRDEHLGADAAQEAFLRLWTLLHERTGSPPRDAGAWLRRVAARVSLDWLRAGNARRRAHEAAAARATEPAAPKDSLQETEWNEALERALATLPDGQRTVFVLRHDAGLALSEVATALELSLPTVKTHFARAVLTLSQRLRAFAPDPAPKPIR